MTDKTEAITRVALVTGASRGIGAAIATELARAGMNIAINCSGQGSLSVAQKLANDLACEFEVETAAIAADVSDFAQAASLVSGVKDRFGRLDVLVNNAGINRDGLLMRMSEDDFDRVVDTNLKGAFNCIRHATPIMMKQRYGRIVSLSSIVGIAGNAGQANYAASKAGIIGLTKSVAKELAPRNITVNALAPGFIDTQMTREMPEKARKAMLARIPARRAGTVEDVARAAVFFAGEDADYITGQVLVIDGGLL